jgi:hypothetical protein
MAKRHATIVQLSYNQLGIIAFWSARNGDLGLGAHLAGLASVLLG